MATRVPGPIAFGADGFPPLDRTCPRCLARSVLRDARYDTAEDICSLCGHTTSHAHRGLVERDADIRTTYERLRLQPENPPRRGRPPKEWKA